MPEFTEWKKIMTKLVSEKELVPKIYKELKDLPPKQINTKLNSNHPINRWVSELDSSQKK